MTTPSGPLATDGAATSAGGTAAQALADTVVLETLTDEELAVLTVADTVVVNPFLATVRPGERAALLRTAYRGLLARGIVDPPTEQARERARDDADTGGAVVPVELQVRTDVVTVVTLRQAASAVVAMARTTALAQDYLYAHLVDDVALVEEVSSDGLHRFVLRRRQDLIGTVLAAAVHPEAGDAAGEPTELRPVTPDDPTPPDAVLEAAGEALVRCDLTVLRVGGPASTMLGLFSAPAGSWVFRSRRADGGPVVVEPCSADTLRAAVTDLLDPVVAP